MVWTQRVSHREAIPLQQSLRQRTSTASRRAPIPLRCLSTSLLSRRTLLTWWQPLLHSTLTGRSISQPSKITRIIRVVKFWPSWAISTLACSRAYTLTCSRQSKWGLSRDLNTKNSYVDRLTTNSLKRSRRSTCVSQPPVSSTNVRQAPRKHTSSSRWWPWHQDEDIQPLQETIENPFF